MNAYEFFIETIHWFYHQQQYSHVFNVALAANNARNALNDLGGLASAW